MLSSTNLPEDQLATASTQNTETGDPRTPASSTVQLRGADDGRVEGRLLEVGQGSPVVFLSGLVGVNEHWLRVAQTVKDHLRCIMLEVPLLELMGDDCSIEGVTEMVGRYLADEVGEPAVLVGSSFGGHVSLRLGVQNPDLVRGLVLVGSSGLGEKPFGGPRVKRSRSWVEDTIAELFYDRSKMLQEDVDRAWNELSGRVKAKRMFRLSRSVFKDHMGDRIPSIKAPTMVLWGREDLITLPEVAEQFAEAIPDAEMVWIERCGHAPMIEKPDEFADALLRFATRIGICDA